MSTQPSFAAQPPWRRPGFLVAATCAVLVVLAALAMAVLGGGAGHDPAGSGQPAEPTAANGDTPPASAVEPPVTAPAGVTWTMFGQRPLPYSTSEGPGAVTDSTASGYSHTPVGALIASAQISARSGLSSGKSVYEPTVLTQMVPSRDRDTLLAALRGAPQQPAAPGELSTIAGFRFVTYTTDTAVVELFRRGSVVNGRYQVSLMTMVWQDGDWRMQAPPGGSWLSVTHVAADLSGVIEWGP